jgi:putative FmdB family regulatory protein
MPTYDYRCRACGHRFELFHGINDETPKRCPKCRKRAVRVPAGGAGLLFRGSGFHVTDYRSKDYREKAKRESSGKASPGPSTGGSSSSGSKPKGE